MWGKVLRNHVEIGKQSYIAENKNKRTQRRYPLNCCLSRLFTQGLVSVCNGTEDVWLTKGENEDDYKSLGKQTEKLGEDNWKLVLWYVSEGLQVECIFNTLKIVKEHQKAQLEISLVLFAPVRFTPHSTQGELTCEEKSILIVRVFSFKKKKKKIPSTN